DGSFPCPAPFENRRVARAVVYLTGEALAAAALPALRTSVRRDGTPVRRLRTTRRARGPRTSGPGRRSADRDDVPPSGAAGRRPGSLGRVRGLSVWITGQRTVVPLRRLAAADDETSSGDRGSHPGTPDRRPERRAVVPEPRDRIRRFRALSVDDGPCSPDGEGWSREASRHPGIPGRRPLRRRGLSGGEGSPPGSAGRSRRILPPRL